MDSSHWRVHQDVFRSDGREAAILTIQGGWIDLDSRRPIVPPAELAAVLQGLPRTRDFEEFRHSFGAEAATRPDQALPSRHRIPSAWIGTDVRIATSDQERAIRLYRQLIRNAAGR